MAVPFDDNYYEPNDLANPAEITSIRYEGRYKHERRYLINAVVSYDPTFDFPEGQYRATAEVHPNTPPPSGPWVIWSPGD